MNPEKPRSTSTKRWLRRGIYAVLAVLAAAVIAIAARPKPLAVEAVRARRGLLRVSIEEPGKTRVRDRFVVSAPLAGEMSRVELKPGDRVDAKTVLARLVPASAPLLDPRSRAEGVARVATADAATAQARAAVDRAQLALDHAKTDLERDQRLVASGAIQREVVEHSAVEVRLREAELASARFGVRRSAHEAEMARAALAVHDEGKKGQQQTFVVPSPIEGKVLRVLTPHAGFVQPGTPLVELGDPSALEIVVDALTPDAITIPPLARVALERWGGRSALEGHVRLVEPSATTRLSALGVEEQRVSVVIDLDSPREQWASLGDGFRVEAEIVVWEQEGVLSVPISALFRRGERWSVFAIEGGKARLKAVEIGQRSSREVQILSGLGEGDVIIVHPSERVADGVAVAPRG